MCLVKVIRIVKHIHETLAFLVKSRILRTSVYNVYGSQNEFVERVTRIFILRMRSLGLNGPLLRDTVFAVARIVHVFLYAVSLNEDGAGPAGQRFENLNCRQRPQASFACPLNPPYSHFAKQRMGRNWGNQHSVDSLCAMDSLMTSLSL